MTTLGWSCEFDVVYIHDHHGPQPGVPIAGSVVVNWLEACLEGNTFEVLLPNRTGLRVAIYVEDLRYDRLKESSAP